MALFTTPIKSLNDLFLHTLKDMYYAENQIVKSLPKMIEKAHDPTLRSTLESHLSETKQQVTRLEQIFQGLGEKAQGATCAAMDGILDEAKDVMSDIGDPNVLDAGMLSAAQAVEHYEISRYGTLRTWAAELGHRDIVKLIEETLGEEKKTNDVLTKLAENGVNQHAQAA